MIKKYFCYTKAAYKSSGFYILNYLLELFGSLVILVSFYYLWKSVYGNDVTTLHNFTLSEMTSYVLMSRIMSKLYVSDLGDLIGDKVMSGDIVLYLLKPNQPMIALAMQNFGDSLFQMVRVSIPLYIISIFMFQVKVPNVMIWLTFILSIMLSYILFTMVSLLVGILSFYTQGIRGINFLKVIIISFFSGAFIPIDLFPQMLKNIANFLPFRGMYYLPLQIFLGKTSYSAIWSVYIEQIIWIVIILVIIQWLWIRGKEKLIVKGG